MTDLCPAVNPVLHTDSVYFTPRVDAVIKDEFISAAPVTETADYDETAHLTPAILDVLFIEFEWPQMQPQPSFF